MGDLTGGGPLANYADGDKPEFVAGLVLQAIEEGQAQYFANDRLRKMAGVGAWLKLAYLHHEFSRRGAIRQRFVGEFCRLQVESTHIHPGLEMTGFYESRCFAQNLPVM